MHAVSRTLYGGRLSNPPSRFLADIEVPTSSLSGLESFGEMINAPEKLNELRYVPELVEGDGVKHQLFGMGTVVEMEGDLATIYFKGKGTKKLDIGFAPLEKI
jgi:hypothetical protein